ncbi:MAG TPA: TIGR01841 family phasin [Roseiarcus sp.]|nr:TIGR01841 family phasin [Roseiarcus sp.]
MANYQKKGFPAPATHVAQQALLAEAEAPMTQEPLQEPIKVETAPAAKDFGGNVRALVEKSIVESRGRYAQAKTVAEEASAAVEASYGAARDGVVAFNVKAIEAIKADADANFELIKSLAAAKSVSELVTLQTEFARKRFEIATARGNELTELARNVADQAAAPIKAHVAKTLKVAV